MQSLAADGSIRTGVVGSSQLADNAVTSAKLAPSAVTASHLSTGSVTNSAITDGAIAQGKIANLSGDLAGKASTAHTHSIADTTSLQTTLDSKAASVHTHTASQISDASTAGRSLMTAADAATQRSALGLGSAATLTVGTTAGTVAAGDDNRLTGAQSAATLDADVAALVGDGGSSVASVLSSTFARNAPFHPGGGSVSMWYDDGKASTYTEVYPRHVRLGLPAQFAIITGSVGTAGYITVAQLQEMAANRLIRIASHTATNPSLVGLTEANLKTELMTAYSALKGWGVVPDRFPFVAPSLQYTTTAYKYLYLLHTCVRDFPESNTQGYWYGAPNQASFPQFGSYEISTRLGKSVTTMLTEIRLLVEAGLHVPLMLHDIIDGGDSYSITPAQHEELLQGIVNLGIPVIHPEASIRPHNLIRDPIFESSSTYWTSDSGSGSVGFSTSPSSTIYLGTRSYSLGWNGTGTAPKIRYKYPIPVEAGKTYRVDWWAKGNGTNTDQRTEVYVEYITGTSVSGTAQTVGTPTTIDHAATALTFSFQHFTGTFTAPAEAHFARLWVRYNMGGQTAGSTQWLYVDAITCHDANLPAYNV